MKKLLFILVTVIGLLTTGKAQELKCEVRVNANQVEGSDRTVFQSLQTSLYEFINNTKFTDINFRQNEKIDCSILVNIKTRENNDFTAEVNVALSRPVYKTNYSTPLFNYIDRKVYFEYMEGTTLDFNPTTYISNLTHIIGYYVYLMLGLDFDSFSLYGGEPFRKTRAVTMAGTRAEDKTATPSSTKSPTRATVRCASSSTNTTVWAWTSWPKSPTKAARPSSTL